MSVDMQVALCDLSRLARTVMGTFDIHLRSLPLRSQNKLHFHILKHHKDTPFYNNS